MNKKHLSVVMAGAMLATSVAPVLAADAVTVPEYTLAADQTGLLIEGLRNFMNSEKFEDGTIGTMDAKDKSVYAYQVNKGNKSYVTSNLQADLANLAKGDVVTIYKHDTAKNQYGELTSLAQEDVVVKGEVETYKDETALKNEEAAIKALTTNEFIKDAKYDEKAKTLTVTLNKAKDIASDEVEFETIVLAVGDNKLDWNKPLAANGRELTPSKKEDVIRFAKFAEVVSADSKTITAGQELPVNEIAKVKIATDATAPEVKDTYLVEDLFDGLLLTNKGEELLAAMNDTAADSKYTYNNDIDTKYGVTSFTISVKNAKDPKQDKTITVRGLDKEQADLLIKYLTVDEQVDVLAGSNRYETAVKIAKEQTDIKSLAMTGGHVVLVNGEALVDGLAAAPLAAKYSIAPNNVAAPILLTEANGLPKATKAYIKELVENVPVGKLADVKIDLVGGEGVLSQSLVDELEAYGLTVNRFGGDNREETSLAVAKEVGSSKGAFVVGANGEADAMSVAPVAAEKDMPIIVSKSAKGISKDGLYEMKDLGFKNATVIGGAGVIAADTEEALKAKGVTATRIAGSNRQDTNAKIIAEYYDLSKEVIVAKDGQKNKAELVDALTAANLASQKNAPIVLATDKLSKGQINELNKHAKNAQNLYQVGYGVNRTVLEKVAQLLNLPRL